MTHQGRGFYGPPKGVTVTALIIGDCFCRENHVIIEWMLRVKFVVDNQIGLDSSGFCYQLVLNLKESGNSIPSVEDYVESWTVPPDFGPLSEAA